MFILTFYCHIHLRPFDSGHIQSDNLLNTHAHFIYTNVYNKTHWMLKKMPANCYLIANSFFIRIKQLGTRLQCVGVFFLLSVWIIHLRCLLSGPLWSRWLFYWVGFMAEVIVVDTTQKVCGAKEFCKEVLWSTKRNICMNCFILFLYQQPVTHNGRRFLLFSSLKQTIIALPPQRNSSTGLKFMPLCGNIWHTMFLPLFSHWRFSLMFLSGMSYYYPCVQVYSYTCVSAGILLQLSVPTLRWSNRGRTPLVCSIEEQGKQAAVRPTLRESETPEEQRQKTIRSDYS